MAPAAKRSKYGAVKTVVNGITFASKAEARRYVELIAMHAAGEISDLRLQPTYELAQSVKFSGASRATPALRYRADFSYVDKDGKKTVEDVKGKPTEGYRIKRHLMLALFGIEVKEVKCR
jgi:hypothetical protein